MTSRLPVSERIKSPDRMAASLHSSISDTNGEDAALMTRSLDPFLLFSGANQELGTHELLGENPSLDASCGALQGASKLVPVPESLMSPEYRQPVIPKPRPVSAVAKRSSPKPVRTSRPKSGTPGKTTKPPEGRTSPVRNRSSDEDSEYSTSKLDSILQRAQQRRDRSNCSNDNLPNKMNNVHNGSSESAALCIQRVWRGYRTRNLDKKVIESIQSLQMTRTNEYIQKLSSNMEYTIAALESERKLQALQMQAINALWKKVSGQPPEEGQTIVNLAQTCSQLHTQVSQLQESMNGVIQRIDTFCRPVAEVASTQTDIVAVHTPQSESLPFPYQRTHPRPSSLPLAMSAPEELQQFATSLVDEAIKTVAPTVDQDELAISNGVDLGSGSKGELLSLEENSSSIMICRQPPSTLNTPQDNNNNEDDAIISNDIASNAH